MFPSRLKKLRLEKGLTQKELAQKLNMQNTAISKYELNERKPDIDTLNQLAKFFNVSADYLLGNTDIAAGYIATNNKKSKNIKQSQKYTIEDKELLNDISSLDDDLKKEAKKYIELLKLKQNIDKGKSEQSATSEKDA